MLVEGRPSEELAGGGWLLNVKNIEEKKVKEEEEGGGKKQSDFLKCGEGRGVVFISKMVEDVALGRPYKEKSPYARGNRNEFLCMHRSIRNLI